NANRGRPWNSSNCSLERSSHGRSQNSVSSSRSRSRRPTESKIQRPVALSTSGRQHRAQIWQRSAPAKANPWPIICNLPSVGSSPPSQSRADDNMKQQRRQKQGVVHPRRSDDGQHGPPSPSSQRTPKSNPRQNPNHSKGLATDRSSHSNPPLFPTSKTGQNSIPSNLSLVRQRAIITDG
ncbi:hypothetical protein ACLOJK_034274, partial [Asimina triloba]